MNTNLSAKTSNQNPTVGNVETGGLAPTTWRQIPFGNLAHAHKKVTRKPDSQGNIRCAGLYLILEGEPMPEKSVLIYLNRHGDPIGWGHVENR
jgi:hypothetical protein